MTYDELVCGLKGARGKCQVLKLIPDVSIVAMLTKLQATDAAGCNPALPGLYLKSGNLC